jgi:anaerobic selenocysteine-containing dehydrogenase
LIHLAPQLYLDDLERVERTFFVATTATKEFPLSLVSRRLPRSHNSWTHNSHRLVKGKNQCTLLVNSDDASEMNLSSGQMAQVKSKVGELTVGVEVSDEMMPGVVSIPHGWGHDIDGMRMRTARLQPGVNINDLTDESVVDELTGNACFSGIPVSVHPIT